MWSQQGAGDDVQGSVAVAVEKDNKGSQNALKWAVENLVNRGQTLVLIHIVNKQPSKNLNSFLLFLTIEVSKYLIAHNYFISSFAPHFFFLPKPKRPFSFSFFQY